MPADNAEASAKNDSQEEEANGTAGADRLSDVLAMTDGGGGSSSLIIINITQQFSITATLGAWRFRLPCPLSQHSSKPA